MSWENFTIDSSDGGHYNPGNYTIRIRARDSYTAESDWVTHDIEIEKNKSRNSFILKDILRKLFNKIMINRLQIII